MPLPLLPFCEITERYSGKTGSFDRLPQRLLYAGEFFSVQLVGLQPDRSLYDYRPPERILLLVSFGALQFRVGEESYDLSVGEMAWLETNETYHLFTTSCADLLMVTVSPGRDVLSFINPGPKNNRWPKTEAIIPAN